MKKEKKFESFNPNGVGLNNGHFIGLPFNEKEAKIVLFSVPWDVTVSYGEGTATAPQNILECSIQLDLYDEDIEEAWKLGIFFKPSDKEWLRTNHEYRLKSKEYIEALENGIDIDTEYFQNIRREINQICFDLKTYVYHNAKLILSKNKLLGIVGGEHSVPLGAIEALAEQYEAFGILQIDAHCDLRAAYEGFTYSHASIFYNVLPIESIKKIVQVGIRDSCQEEVERIQESEDRIICFSNQQIQEHQFLGNSFDSLCTKIIEQLPQSVYISFDIDGLQPNLCPNTGTPVPGGLTFDEAIYLIKEVVLSGRTIIGFDLCEVGGLGNEWDGNVGARVLYKLANWTIKSHESNAPL